MKKKLIYISNMAAPYQVKFCYALQEYFDAEFWFYVHLEKNRPEWWKIPLGEKCKILRKSFFVPGFNYCNLRLPKLVKESNPDILILGGFNFPCHYILKRWAKRNNKIVVVLSERILFTGYNTIAKSIKILFKRIILSLFKDVDLVFAIGEEPYRQYIERMGFNPSRVIIMQYPQDIDQNLLHSLREANSEVTLIFPNRLDILYNPLFALEIFARAIKKYSNLTMKMNTMGELKDECIKFISDNNLDGHVTFIENIQSWDQLPQVYSESDIALFTAIDSNGPNSLIECMASGMGILLSKNIFNTESYAIHGENCFRLELDHDQFLEALDNYLAMPNLLKQHGLRAKEMVKYRSVSHTAILYDKILNGRSFEAK